MNSEVNPKVSPGFPIQIQYIYSFTATHQDKADDVRHSVNQHKITEFLKENNNALVRQDIIKLLKSDGADFIEDSLRISREGTFFKVLDDWKLDLSQNENLCLLLFWIQAHNSTLQEKLNEVSETLSKLNQKVSNLGLSLSHEESKVNHSNKRRLDIAIVDSEPLVKIDEYGIVSLGGFAHDYSYEEVSLLNLLEAQGKNINLHFDIASLQNFVNVLSLSPKVLHIMCHGEVNRATGRFFLSFERDGALREFYTEDLRAILQEINFETKLVFVNACHSESVAQVFIEAGVPCVVAVQSESKVSLLAAKKFAEFFYMQLFEGKSIENAFKYAKLAVHDEEVHTCCCGHSHKKDCAWYKLAKEEGFEKAHSLHTPTCTDCFRKFGHKNLHKENCMWAFDFLTEVCAQEDFPKGNVSICCCSPELPHDEAMKFRLIYQDKRFAEQVLFENMEEGKVKITSRHSFGDQKFSIQKLTDCNKELYQIMTQVTNQDNRIIELYGLEGIGKTTLAKQAANYMIMRDQFLRERVHMINLNQISDIESFRLSFLEELPGSVDLRAFCESVRNNRMLFILDKCDELLRTNLERFRQDLAFIIEHAPNVKFLIITCSKIELNMGEIFLTIQFTKMQAAKLLHIRAYQYLNLYERAVYNLVEHGIFDLISLNPQAIWSVAEKLRNGRSLDEIETELDLERNQ